MGKGYAVEQAAQAAEARGLTSALISVGGNLRAIGTKPDGSQWVGGVENPWNSSEVYTNGSSTVAAVKMSDLSLVTSGDYQRYYVVDGVRYHHLIDPATLWPAAYFDGVSVLAPDSGVADCLTTGLFCLPLEEGRQLVESLDGVEALWCTTDGEVITSSGWSDHPEKVTETEQVPPLRHGSCTNDEEGTFISYISRIFLCVHSSIQAHFAIRTAPRVMSATTSSTTQTDATALSRTASESMTKWNRYALSRSFRDFCGWIGTPESKGSHGAPPPKAALRRLQKTSGSVSSTAPKEPLPCLPPSLRQETPAVQHAAGFIITLAMLLMDATPHRSIASTPPCPAPYIKAFGKSIGFTRNLMAM